MAILFLSFKRATTVPNKLIDSQHYKRLRRKTLTAFHSLSHFTLTTTQLNASSLKNLKSLQNDSGTGTIFSQPPLILFITSKLALLFPSVLTSAFHSINLFMFSRHLIPTTSVAPISACKPTHNLQFLLTKG